jgi:hypothetical protein
MRARARKTRGIDTFTAPRMKHHLLLLGLAMISTAPVFAGDYNPELFASTRLVYADSFDSGTLNTDFWEVRQNSTWVIKDGILAGSQSSKEFQEKMVAKGDKAHAGFKPVIWLKQVPENFVLTLRVRYDATAYQRGFPLIDLGHHIHTLSFSEKATTLTVRKDVEKIAVGLPLFTLNQWHEVAIELKKGTLLLTIDGRRHRFESPNIDMADQSQIDFKAVDLGTCQIDSVRLWEGK